MTLAIHIIQKIQKIMNVIDKLAPMKEQRVKQNSQEWCGGEIANGIKNRDSFFKKFKESKLHLEKDICIAARYKIQKIIINKRRAFFENKLSESTGKPKDLWKALRSLGFRIKSSSCKVNALKIKNTVEHDVYSVLGGFRGGFAQLWRRTL